MQNEINHFFRRKKIYNACGTKMFNVFFSNFRKYVMHVIKMFNVFLFYFLKLFLKNEDMQRKMRLMFFIFKNHLKKKKICNVCETKKCLIFFIFQIL